MRSYHWRSNSTDLLLRTLQDNDKTTTPALSIGWLLTELEAYHTDTQLSLLPACCYYIREGETETYISGVLPHYHLPLSIQVSTRIEELRLHPYRYCTYRLHSWISIPAQQAAK